MKIVARRSVAVPSRASAVASSCATLRVVERVRDAGHHRHAGGGVVLRLHQLHHDVWIEGAWQRRRDCPSPRACARETSPRRCWRGGRKAARTVAACEVNIGEPSRRALGRHDGGSPDRRCRPCCRRIASNRSCERSSNIAFCRRQSTARWSARDRARLPGSRTSPSSPREDAGVVNLLDHQRRMAVGLPDARRAATAPALGRFECQQAEERLNRFGRDFADEGQRQDVAIRAASPRPRRFHSGCRRRPCLPPSACLASRRSRRWRRVTTPRIAAPSRVIEIPDGRMLGRGTTSSCAPRSTRARASCCRPRASSGDSWETWDTNRLSPIYWPGKCGPSTSSHPSGTGGRSLAMR